MPAGLSPPAGVTVAQSHCRGVDGEAACLGLWRPSRGGRRVCWGQDGAGSCLALPSQCLACALVPASQCLWLDLEWGGGLRSSPAPFSPSAKWVRCCAASEASVRSEVRADGLTPRPSPPTGAPGGAHHLLGEPLPVPGGQQEVEEPLQSRAAQLRAGALREQSGEVPPRPPRPGPALLPHPRSPLLCVNAARPPTPEHETPYVHPQPATARVSLSPDAKPNLSIFPFTLSCLPEAGHPLSEWHFTHPGTQLAGGPLSLCLSPQKQPITGTGSSPWPSRSLHLQGPPPPSAPFLPWASTATANWPFPCLRALLGAGPVFFPS